MSAVTKKAVAAAAAAEHSVFFSRTHSLLGILLEPHGEVLIAGKTLFLTIVSTFAEAKAQSGKSEVVFLFPQHLNSSPIVILNRQQEENLIEEVKQPFKPFVVFRVGVTVVCLSVD